MLFIKINNRLLIKQTPVFVYKNRRCQSIGAASAKEVEPSVQYPPILNETPPFRMRRKVAEWHEEIKKVKTVQEKLIKVNMPRYWGYKCAIIEEKKIGFNELLSSQYITRTHIFDQTKLPAYYDNLIELEKLKSIVEDVKGSVYDGIAFEFLSRLYSPEQTQPMENNPVGLENLKSDLICKQINRIMLSNLSGYYSHLKDVQTIHNPAIRSYWCNGGIEVDKEIVKLIMKKNKFFEPVDKKFQFIGSQILHLRHQLALNTILPYAESQNDKLEVPVFKYDPKTVGRFIQRRHLISNPGFLPGDSSEFGFMSYHNRGYILARGAGDDLDALRTHAVYSNFGWLTAQAYNFGFTTYNDITYPLVNQMIITNGQWWSFCVYQLNTLLLNGYNADENTKRNFCWITEPMKLFDKIEDGKLVGINDAVVENLVKFYANIPQERVGVELRPYLKKTKPRVADIEDTEKRAWLDKSFKHLVSERPRHHIPPELYTWEWIYKIKFKTRPLDKKVSPYDFGIDPFLRRLDEHDREYIPKCKRVIDDQGKGYKIKYKKTYYP